MNKQISFVLVLAILFFSFSLAQETNTMPWDAMGLADDWAAFKLKFLKVYDSIASEAKAFEAWLRNRKAVHASSHSNKTWEEGETSMSDVTDEEFKRHYLNLVVPKDAKKTTVKAANSGSKVSAAPDSFDWRSKGKVTPVKNQGGRCGSCWAFATIGAIESLNLILGNNQETYSEQFLVDCIPKNGNTGCNGCDGGWAANAMYWIQNNGIVPESTCPYKAKVTGQSYCSSIKKSNLKIKGVAYINGEDFEGLVNAVTIQPVIVSVDASKWINYKRGIFNDCKSNVNNHAVLLVGYTSDSWIIKNSWGTGWGENGYIRLTRPGNTCGLANYAVYPVRDDAASGTDVGDGDHPDCYKWTSFCHSNEFVMNNCPKTCQKY